MNLQFDATTVSPQAAPQALPISDSTGWLSRIVASEAKPTKDSTPENKSGFLELTLEIIDGPFKGLKGCDRLNIWNASQVAVDIAYSRLSAYCHVTGKYKINVTEELHGIPLRICVRQQKGSDTYTEIYAVKDANGNDPGKSGPATAPQPTGFGAPAQAAPAAIPVAEQPASGPWSGGDTAASPGPGPVAPWNN